jgi:hypothetical protein
MRKLSQKGILEPLLKESLGNPFKKLPSEIKSPSREN